MDKDNLVIFASGLLIILLSLFSYTFVLQPKNHSNSKDQEIWPLVPIYNDEVNIPDPNNLKSIPKNTIDISDWLTYKNNDIGIEFKYPPEWGEYKEELDQIDSQFVYDLSFENSDFNVGGTSAGFTSSRGGCDHSCFSGNKTINKYCDYMDTFECRSSGADVLYKTLYPCETTPDSGEQFMLVYLVNTPDSGYVDGLGFGGTWAIPDSPLWDWRSCNKKDLKKIKELINERKYDQDSATNLDTYQAVINSIKI